MIKWALKSEAFEEEEEVEYAITLPSFCSGLRVNYYDSSAKAKSLIRWYFRFGFLYNRIEPAQFEFLISFWDRLICEPLGTNRLDVFLTVFAGLSGHFLTTVRVVANPQSPTNIKKN